MDQDFVDDYIVVYGRSLGSVVDREEVGAATIHLIDVKSLLITNLTSKVRECVEGVMKRMFGVRHLALEWQGGRDCGLYGMEPSLNSDHQARKVEVTISSPLIPGNFFARSSVLHFFSV